MPYVIEGNSMLEIQIVGRLHGQRTRNVFHYLYPLESPDLPDGKAAAQAALDGFVVGVLAELRVLTSVEMHYERVTAQWVKPTRYRAVGQDIVADGTVQGACLPSYCAVVVSKTTDLAHRAFQGRNYFPGIPSIQEDDSRLTDTAHDNWTIFADVLLDPLNLGIPSSDVQLITKTPDSLFPLDASSVVTAVSVNNVLRVQRRREVGVGE